MRRHRASIYPVKLAKGFEDEIGEEGHGKTGENSNCKGDQDGGIDTRFCNRNAAFQANRCHQIERHTLCQRLGNGKI